MFWYFSIKFKKEKVKYFPIHHKILYPPDSSGGYKFVSLYWDNLLQVFCYIKELFGFKQWDISFFGEYFSYQIILFSAYKYRI